MTIAEMRYYASIEKIARSLEKLVDIMENKQTKTCCICGKQFDGYGNNPYPIKNEGQCCDECNQLVIAKRIEMMKGENNAE